MAAAGCGPPISNAPFLQESQFQTVLPSARRHGPPVEVWLAPNADNPILASAKQAASEYSALLDLPIDIGDVLRATPPDVRTDRSRQWTAAELAAGANGQLTTDDTLVRGWIRAEVVNPIDGGFELTVALATDAEGPYVEVATGAHDGTSVGSLTWDLAATASALDLSPPDPLATVWLTLDERAELDDGRTARSLQAVYAVDPVAPLRGWLVVGDDTLSFSADLLVTDDEVPRPGWATAVHNDGIGGIAVGAVLDGEDELPFEACWDGQGALTFVSGPAPVIREGSRGSCLAELSR